MAKELEEKRQQEENQRLKEVGGKKDIKEPSRKKSLLGVKQVCIQSEDQKIQRKIRALN